MVRTLIRQGTEKRSPKLQNAYAAAATSARPFVKSAYWDLRLQTLRVLLLHSCLHLLLMAFSGRPKIGVYSGHSYHRVSRKPAGMFSFVPFRCQAQRYEHRQLLWVETIQSSSYLYLVLAVSVTEMNKQGLRIFSPQRRGKGEPFLPLQIFRFSSLWFSIDTTWCP